MGAFHPNRLRRTAKREETEWQGRDGERYRTFGDGENSASQDAHNELVGIWGVYRKCDAVVHLRNGTSGLIEIKLGGERLIEEGARSLAKLSGIIDTARMKGVAFKMVLTATGDYAYTRPDGIIVCPISCLKS